MKYLMVVFMLGSWPAFAQVTFVDANTVQSKTPVPDVAFDLNDPYSDRQHATFTVTSSDRDGNMALVDTRLSFRVDISPYAPDVPGITPGLYNIYDEHGDVIGTFDQRVGVISGFTINAPYLEIVDVWRPATPEELAPDSVDYRYIIADELYSKTFSARHGGQLRIAGTDGKTFWTSDDPDFNLGTLVGTYESTLPLYGQEKPAQSATAKPTLTTLEEKELDLAISQAELAQARIQIAQQTFQAAQKAFQELVDKLTKPGFILDRSTGKWEYVVKPPVQK